ncbi:unnamed protein product, partial [Ectocarpus sp. 12 AP-2014]
HQPRITPTTFSLSPPGSYYCSCNSTLLIRQLSPAGSVWRNSYCCCCCCTNTPHTHRDLIYNKWNHHRGLVFGAKFNDNARLWGASGSPCGRRGQRPDLRRHPQGHLLLLRRLRRMRG